MEVKEFWQRLRDLGYDTGKVVKELKQNPIYSAKQLRHDIENMPWVMFYMTFEGPVRIERAARASENYSRCPL